jgi:hypothetical protein
MRTVEKNKQKAKFGALFGLGLIASTFVTGCNIQELNYQGKVRPVNEVEEMLSDYLESENPQFDLNVEITQEVED